MIKKTMLLLIVCFLLFGCNESKHEENQIKIGAIMELTGSIPAVGASSKNAAEMAVNEVNKNGGIVIGNKTLPVKLILEDDADKGDQAAAAAQKLITKDDVLAIIGPNSSSGAIPAAEIAESDQTVLITPWSTNPKVTLDTQTNKPKQYVFRACFTDIFESRVLARFAYETLKAQTAAVLYDVASEAPSSQAATFKDSFEKLGGKVVAFETYTTHDKDFSAQLTKIKAINPQVIFLPTYYNDVSLVAQQAKRLGLNVPFLGSDAWSSPDLIKLSNGAVEGSYFANHYSAEAETPVTREFVEKYQKLYGKEPDDIAALTYDAFHFLFKAIATSSSLDRQAVRNSISNLPMFEGVTGIIKFSPNSGDPDKTAVIMQVKGDKFVWIMNGQA